MRPILYICSGILRVHFIEHVYLLGQIWSDIIYANQSKMVKSNKAVLSCQPRVTVTSRFVYKVIRDLESIDRLCINPIQRIGLIHK